VLVCWVVTRKAFFPATVGLTVRQATGIVKLLVCDRACMVSKPRPGHGPTDEANEDKTTEWGAALGAIDRSGVDEWGAAAGAAERVDEPHPMRADE
jgi:hypothetical protein